jgi:hypothetical protein
VLEAILDPLHRAFQAQRDPGDQHLLGVEHHHLRPESAADEGRDHAHLAFGKAKHRRQPVADEDRRLGGVPDRQLFRLVVPVGDDSPRFHRV